MLAKTTRLKALIFFLVVTSALLWTAIYNGYPLYSYDTDEYLQGNFASHRQIDRPILYALLVRLCLSIAPTLWSVIIVQALIVAYVTMLSLRRRPWFVQGAVVLIVAGFTGASWSVSQIMPYVFAPVMIACMLHLLFRWSTLSFLDRFLCFVLLWLSVAMHFSHLVLATGMLVLWVPIFLFGKKSLRARRPAITVATAVLLGFFTVPLLNKLFLGSGHFSKTAHIVYLAKFHRDGNLKLLLRDHCESQRYILCPYREQLEPLGKGQFLYSPKSPYTQIPGLLDPPEESWRMIRDIISYYPLSVIKSVGRFWGRQFVAIQIGDGFTSDCDPFPPIAAIRTLTPADENAFLHSKQHQRLLDPLIEFLLLVQPWLEALLMGLAVVLALTQRGIATQPLWFLLSALILNAGVFAVFSNTFHESYQNRLVWLSSLMTLLSFISMDRVSNCSFKQNSGKFFIDADKKDSP